MVVTSHSGSLADVRAARRLFYARFEPSLLLYVAWAAGFAFCCGSKSLLVMLVGAAAPGRVAGGDVVAISPDAVHLPAPSSPFLASRFLLHQHAQRVRRGRRVSDGRLARGGAVASLGLAPRNRAPRNPDGLLGAFRRVHRAGAGRGDAALARRAVRHRCPFDAENARPTGGGRPG